MTANRSRTFSWHDPLETARLGATMSGLDFLRAMQAGEVPAPPIAATLDFTIVAIEEGRVELACEPAEFHYNPIGVVHGGLVCTLLDTATGCAGHTTLPAGVGYTSIDLTVNYLRPVVAGTGPIRVVGTVVKPGRRVIAAVGEVRDAAGRILATATSNLLVMPLAG